MEKKKKYDKILSLEKSEWNSVEVLISKTIIDPNISHDEFALTNKVLKEYDVMKQKIKNGK